MQLRRIKRTKHTEWTQSKSSVVCYELLRKCYTPMTSFGKCKFKIKL
jgi:hypothetical protein